MFGIAMCVWACFTADARQEGTMHATAPATDAAADRAAMPGGRRGLALLWLFCMLTALVLCALNLVRGELNQDEGWYLYAASQVREGRVPYIDFATTQGPVLPFVYALAYPAVERWGVAGGRAVTAGFGFASALLAVWLSRRLSGQTARSAAGLLAFALVAVNVYQSYFVTIVKTYALAALFLTAGFVALSYITGRRPHLAAALSGALLALAGGTRTSAFFALPAVFLALAAAERGASRVGLCRLWLTFAASATVATFLLFAPFMLFAPGGVWFALVEYHAGRSVGGPVQALAYKAGFVSRLVRDYFVPIGLWAFLLLYLLVFRRGRGPQRHDRCQPPLSAAVRTGAWGSVAAITLVHLMAPFPYDDYQVIVFPLFCAALAAAAVVTFRSTSRDPRTAAWALTGVVLLCAAAAFSSPQNESWFIGKRDRIWWPLKAEAPLARLRRAADRIRALAEPGDELLTQDPYLAVEAGLRLPEGLELGPFSYFPVWPREKAQAYHVLNRAMLLNLLATSKAPVAAFSGYGLAMYMPEVAELPPHEERALREVLEGRYRLVDTIENFGQAETTLRIYALRPGAD